MAAVQPPTDGPLITDNDHELEPPKSESQSSPDASEDVNKEPAQVYSQPSPSLRIYSRPQILALSKSPLVCVPPNMPELRDWFGAENEQNLSRKESEPLTPNSGRERRCILIRPLTFRSASDAMAKRTVLILLDQPRPSFRSSMSQPSQMGNFKHQSMRTNDRDLEREGQERLRNLSEKFDRDRLNGPLLNIRTEKRNIAATSSNRIPSQSQGTIAARRAETRETAKKKVGESNEDWRRGVETRRSERNDRGDRDERPRSRSRHRRESSLTRRDREGKEREKERDDYKRERVDRDRDDDDESRRWRDDGRRDERLASRRERERGPNSNGKDKDPNAGNPNDRRWTVVEERDARSKRNTGRDKRSFPEEARTDDRRGDREKEKEPAWMDTYVPSSSTGGILGSKGNEGELDGIQAWKKNLKEKEQKAKTAPVASGVDSSNDSPTMTIIEEPMDEIQRFKKMMEVAQKQSSDPPMMVGPILGLTDTPKLSSTRGKHLLVTLLVLFHVIAASASSKLDIASVPDPSRSLLSLLNSNHDVPLSADTDLTAPKLHSRLPLADNPADRLNIDTSFNPPQGSRLLALGNRAPAKPVAPSSQYMPSAIPNGGPTSASTITPKPQIPPPLTGFVNLSNPLTLATESSKVAPRTPSSFSPFEEQRELGDTLRRQVGERSPFVTDSAGTWPDPSPLDSTNAGHAMGKGSRFAKFFDGKGKETLITAPNIPKAPTPVGFVSSSPGPHVRPDSGFGNISNPSLEQHRTVDELFAKLNMNPMQGQRVVSGPNTASLNHVPFSQQAQSQLHSLQQQHQQMLQNQLHNAARLEPLYESRNFVPDNLVPGLRSAPPPRNRDNGGMYAADPLDDALLLNAQQRLPIQQQRGVEQLFGGSIPASFAQQQQLARSAGIPVQAPQFRGGPSPVSASQNMLHTAQQQRMPPGLANLGARPPHDPAQFIPAPLHNGLHINGPPQQPQQSFNNFHPTGGFGGPQGPLRPPVHQLQNTMNHHQLAGLGHPGTLDSRNANQHAQLLALGLGGAGGLRNISGGGGGGGFNHQAGNSLQNQMLAMRQQAQQQQLHPQMLPHHLLPPHLQQGPPVPTAQTTSAQDLMALLMGAHRE
ncbi:hypothetical protein F5877DRAFT_32456 [Lentinula edodes]|nr:hypothetical protein F5877DRAFT_32456 [Lentinula edodes]